MRYLLDTHVFLWLLSGDSRMPARWRVEITNAANTVFLSVASTWEASIKYQSGKLPLPDHPAVLFPVARSRHMIDALTIDEDTIRGFMHLPTYHKDPFDHLIAAHALQHDLELMTVDTNLRKYPVRLAAVT